MLQFVLTTRLGFLSCVCVRVCVRACQVAKRNRVPLGLDADWFYQHPDVLSRVAMDARRLPTFLAARPPAGQSGAARRERTPLLNVRKVHTRTGNKRKTDRNHQRVLNRSSGPSS